MKALVKELRAQGACFAMAGERVGDAPCLAVADVGIANGTGPDVAVESAGITLLRGDPVGIVRARKLATATLRNIKENLFFAFCLQRSRCAHRGGDPLPLFRATPGPGDRRGDD